MEKRGYSLGGVASRSAARSGGTGIGRIDLGFGRRHAFWFGDRLEEAWWGSKLGYSHA